MGVGNVHCTMSRRGEHFDRLRVVGALALRQKHPSRPLCWSSRTERIEILGCRTGCFHDDSIVMISAASLLPLFLHFDFGFLARTAHCPRLIDPSSTPESRVRLLEIAQTTSFVSI
ncbi:uncharacterized protein BO96DRAFT_346023 [Aspergillus niger CBS 101883]|uniref:uncharacterized protein n=1 Tax=Aspergillus lacticoffeatus (strain CBS 101883) TaxID=1450533 RepID=UPI000D7EBACE|nr:uncharacterized protein BO96DRAFT_346023 [Aspergillus niger CBS 101883]PYH53111.1 hypothetical protein BO96DRAFT_346023 [Aspergillus niger CBS 101883]